MMAKSLGEIAEELKTSDKKIQLIYAFNGVGKTRLSREFKELIAPKNIEESEQEDSPLKILYYNAFTEDLFYWDNDLDTDIDRKIIIRPNGFTNLAFTFLKEQGQDINIAKHFQHYTNSSITPKFNDEFSEVTFSMLRGGDDSINNIKISKGEESNFIWCVFFSLIEQIIEILNTTEKDERSTKIFDNLKYIFIDDPVTSLDENHLIELAVDLAQLIKKSDYKFNKLKFIITTHNPLFYNVMYNEFKNKKETVKYILTKTDNGDYKMAAQNNESPFAYHLCLLQELENAIEDGKLRKYHFNFLRNILEKTSVFLGYNNWTELLPKTDDVHNNPYEKRLINISSHSKYSGEEAAELTDDNSRMLKFLVKALKDTYHFNIQCKEENS